MRVGCLGGRLNEREGGVGRVVGGEEWGMGNERKELSLSKG